MLYEVKAGDTLWQIAKRHCGDPYKWQAIARDNNITSPDRLWIGQILTLRERDCLPLRHSIDVRRAFDYSPIHSNAMEHRQSLVPARAFFFIVADEVDPLRKKVVRKVIVNPAIAEVYAHQLGRPVAAFPNSERFGIHPTDPKSQVTLGRHAMGNETEPLFIGIRASTWNAPVSW